MRMKTSIERECVRERERGLSGKERYAHRKISVNVNLNEKER